MRVITAQESKIRTTERAIKTGGTVIRHVSGFTASAAKKTGNAVKNFDVQFNGGYDEDNGNNNASEEKMPELQSVLAEESRALYGTLSRRQKKRYNRLYQKELSKKQWSSDIIKRNRNLRGNKTEKENILTVKSKTMVNKNVQTATGTAAKSAGTAVRTTSGALTGTATFGVTAAVTAAVDTAKNAAQAAVKVSQKMQQQTAQTQAEQTQQAKHETAAAVSDYSVSQAGENNNLIMLLMAAIICITVMLTSLTVTMQAAVDASGGQGDNNGTVCTQIVEAAQNELNDADKTVGGYRYKNWYGMDANWCAMFVSYCADKCGFIEKGIMPKTASVAASKQWYINNNLYHDAASGYVPKAGDIIIFGNGMSHTGIVTGYNPETKKLTTIEGNSGRSSTTPYHKGSHVKEHTYSITYSKIAGYGTPQYPQDDTAADAAGQENN
ncbi:MAG: CHAP domain-containing protein [Agathobacter rectalis]